MMVVKNERWWTSIVPSSVLATGCENDQKRVMILFVGGCA